MTEYAIVVQNTTFVVSLVTQLATLVLAWIALATVQDIPPILSRVLQLETVVQAVELAWYLLFLYRWVRKMDTPVWWRYLDWMVTTPTMLVNLMFLLFYFHSPTAPESILTDDASKVASIFIVVIFDLIMLLIGFSYEDDGISYGKQNRFKYLQPFPDNKDLGIATGFVPFFGAFAPVFVVLNNRYTGEGLAVVLSTVFVWALYAAAAFVNSVPLRNAAYNVLDVLSKNSIAILTFSIVMNRGWALR